MPPAPVGDGSGRFSPGDQEAAAQSLLQWERDAELRLLPLCDIRARPALGPYCHYRPLLRLEKRLRAHGIDVYKTDIRSPERYLMERFITAPVALTGMPDPCRTRAAAGRRPETDAGLPPKAACCLARH
ncbi:hypothetical protein [Massilia sp. Leaf139]|uniref:hypothetical protein n=1 Tax=Massilia sp. Leaf139 TaxID=1736272 RepID=UPI0006F1C465|nr:hypothetical protein [Massilia sp. Leaf139]KQQ96092.1 hypothetical protein ASF77_21545 [Massilia sp. Leaf139]